MVLMNRLTNCGYRYEGREKLRSLLFAIVGFACVVDPLVK